MRPDERQFLGNVLKVSAVTGFVHAFVETPLHEFGHYWAAALLGVPVYIDGPRVVWASAGPPLPPVHTLILLSGGLWAGSLLWVLALLLKAPYRNGLLPLIAAEFAYAPGDGTAMGAWVGFAAFGIVFGLIAAVEFARFLRWSLGTSRRSSILTRALWWMQGSRVPAPSPVP